MESYSLSYKSHTRKPQNPSQPTQPSQPVAQRRTWRPEEEEQLLIGLKEVVARGWKSDNGFRTGHLGVLEQHMAQHFPHANIKAEPHISSKLHVWKKDYGSLCSMLSRSGFGWNSSANVIEVADNQVWDDYVKTDRNARKMRYKAYPYYSDWCHIFGKDRATGEHGTTWGDAINKVLMSDKGKHPMSTSADNVIPDSVFESVEEVDGTQSTCHGDTASSPVKKKKCTKQKTPKRARVGESPDPSMVSLMTDFFEKTEVTMLKIVDKMNSDEIEHASMRNKVFNSLQDYHHLSISDKMKVTSTICERKDFEIFLNTTPENRDLLITMILGEQS